MKSKIFITQKSIFFKKKKDRFACFLLLPPATTLFKRVKVYTLLLFFFLSVKSRKQGELRRAKYMREGDREFWSFMNKLARRKEQ